MYNSFKEEEYMFKKIGVLTFALCLFFSFSACSTNLILFKSKNIKSILMSDGDITQTLKEEEVSLFVERYGKIYLASDVLEEQENGNKSVGETVYIIKVINGKEEGHVFRFVKVFNQQNNAFHFYFEKNIRGCYYLSHKMEEEDNDFLTELMFGDIIILD